jgi:hypothetical protein
VPTPKVSAGDYQYTNGDKSRPVLNLEGVSQLASMVASLASPSARDWKDSPGMAKETVAPDGSQRSRLDHLPRQAQLAVSGSPPTGGSESTAGRGRLNPEYSRWLMGFQAEWESCASTATPSSRRSRKRS